jgi:hypothetical protein
VNTSEGVFVFEGSGSPIVNISVGDQVRVSGTVTEFSGLTELSNISTILLCSTGNTLPTPATVTLPFASATAAEKYEGMQVSFSQTLTVSETFNLGQYGELLLSSGGRLMNPTNVAEPGAAANAVAAANDLNQITLDDGRGSTYLDPVPYMYGTPPSDITRRVGDTVDDVVGVMHYIAGLYMVEPTAAPSFTATNSRPTSPEDVGGRLTVASFNVLNYFNGNGAGGGFPTSRGANTLAEFNRQRAKTIAALLAIDADVVGLMEMENDDDSSVDANTSAVEDLVNGLNAVAGAGTYAYVETGVVGGDEIRVAIIYKPGSVTPVGDPEYTLAGPFTGFSRPPIAQTFEENSTGEVFTVVVNHFKSKGSACGGDPDIGDEQGNCNQTRIDSAEELLLWLDDDPTLSGDPDYLIIGDFNAYLKEDPIDTLETGGAVIGPLTNLLEDWIGDDSYSYVFFGESGALDNGFATASMATQVTGVTEYHINTDEPVILDYNVESETATQQGYNVGTQYRASDHDPLIVGLDLASPEVTITPSSYDFGSVVVGSSSAAHTFTVENTGGGILILGTLSTTDDFTISNNTCDDAELEGGETCTVDVTFEPQTSGAHTGELTVPSNAASSEDSADLSGEGLTDPGVVPNGNLEDDVNNDKVPDGWKSQRLKPADGVTCANSHSGNCSVLLTGDGTTKQIYVQINQAGAQGDSFNFSMWAKGTGLTGNKATIRIILYYTDNSLGQFIVTLPIGTYDWTQFTKSFTASKAYTRMAIYITQPASAGSLWVDEISLNIN